MTDSAVAAPVGVEAPPSGTPAEEVVQPAVPIEDVALETGRSGDPAQQPLSKRDARRGLHEAHRALQEAQPAVAEDATKEPVAAAVTETDEEKATRIAGEEEAKVNTAGRKYDPATGRLLPEGSALGEVVEGAKPIIVPIPKGHPLLEMGQPTITAASPAEEQVIRALVNGTYSRLKEVEAKEVLLAQRDATILELREKLVRRDASVAAQAKFPQSPEYQKHVTVYNEIRDTVSPEAASAYWQSPAVQNDLRPLEDAEFDSRWSVEQARAEEEAGERWAADALQTAKTTLPPEMVALSNFQQLFDTAVVGYAAEVSAGKHGDIATLTFDDHNKKFSDHLRVRLLADPGMRAVLDAKLTARDKAAADAKEADSRRRAAAAATANADVAKAAVDGFKKQAADTRRQIPPHPLGALTDASRGSDASGRASAERGDGPDYNTMNPRQLRRELKKAARTDAHLRHGNT